MTDRLEVRLVAANAAAGLSAVHPFDLDGARRRLARCGGYEVVHASPSLEVGVYVLVAPEPDREQPDGDDELYIVLDGSGVLDVDGKAVELSEGHAVFVPAGAEHRFTAYEQLCMLVIVERRACDLDGCLDDLGPPSGVDGGADSTSVGRCVSRTV